MPTERYFIEGVCSWLGHRAALFEADLLAWVLFLNLSTFHLKYSVIWWLCVLRVPRNVPILALPGARLRNFMVNTIPPLPGNVLLATPVAEQQIKVCRYMFS